MLDLPPVRHIVQHIAVLALYTVATSAEAQLIAGNLVVYDEDRDITWLRDADSGQNRMTFAAAEAFAQGFTLNGESGWTLPDTPLSLDDGCTLPFNTGDDCTESDLGHLYYTELGNSAGSVSVGAGLQNRGPFTDLDDDVYWSGRQDASGDVWVFNFFNGFQTKLNSAAPSWVWLVRDGKAAGVPRYHWRYIPGWGWVWLIAVLAVVVVTLAWLLARQKSAQSVAKGTFVPPPPGQ